MNIKERILLALKTKASSFGFSKTELEGVAESIAANQSLADDTDEAGINAAIDAVLPVLKVGQQYASRLAEEARRRQEPTPPAGGGGSGDKNDPNNKNDDGEPAWFKSYRESQEQRMAKLEGEKTLEARMAKLREITKDCGKLGESIVRNAARMTFKDDADFEAYLTEAQADIDAYRQELGDDKLGSMNGKPSSGRGGAGDIATDEEIERILS